MALSVSRYLERLRRWGHGVDMIEMAMLIAFVVLGSTALYSGGNVLHDLWQLATNPTVASQ